MIKMSNQKSLDTTSIATYTIAELKEGMKAEISHELTAKDIQIFADLTQDYHPLHTSEAYAKAHGFENIMAHGLLLASFSSKLIGMKLPGERAIVMSQNFRYISPAYPEDDLLIKGVVKNINLEHSTVEVKIKISGQKKKLIASGKYLVKIR